MVRVFFHHRKMATRRFVSPFAGRDRRVCNDLLANHQVGALFWNRDNDAAVVLRRLLEEILVHFHRGLLLDHFVRLLHFRPEQLRLRQTHEETAGRDYSRAN